MHREDMPYYKIDSNDKLVDMRTLPKQHLKALLAFYQGRLKRARSDDMKKAYGQCIQQVSEYLYEGTISGSVDIFTLCKWIGITDLRTFIKTHFGSLKTREELGHEFVMSYFRKRKNVYSDKYVERFFFRCHELGFLPPPHRD